MPPIRIAARPALGVVLALAAAPAARAEPASYAIDPEHFSASFSANHLGYFNLVGLFTEGEGSFTYDEEARALSDLEVTIATDSIFTGHEDRDGHLMSADFLNAAEFPEMTFVMTGAERTGERTGRVTGDLTLVGQTRPLTLDVTLNQIAPYPFGHGKRTIGITATGLIKRSDFGMTYFVPAVSDEIPLTLGFEANRED
ncbi:YceI family protein [Marinivivus vitaminiproducens]|uniref:YceI family protein n=1 Tax=Marinivivus vitaminiproducens TaxID=3035935 RepID=UPI0027A6DA5D|nr:YceI family protein [Geminicoccaceae bacterium SCSIO 64248]